MADKLKPCPFCGSERITVHPIRDGQRTACENCGASSGPVFHGREGWDATSRLAVEKWNTRAALSKAEGREGES